MKFFIVENHLNKDGEPSEDVVRTGKEGEGEILYFDSRVLAFDYARENKVKKPEVIGCDD